MENPQAENGHVEIANEIWDALCRIRIPGEQMQVLLFIIRKTYGWKKKTDGIPLSQFSEATGISKAHIIRALHGLQEKGLISVAKKGNRKWNEYGFIKYYSKWKPLPKKAIVAKKDNETVEVIENTEDDGESLPKKAIESVAKKGNLPLPKKEPSKETKSKETISKETLLSEVPPDEVKKVPAEIDVRLANYLDQKIKKYSKNVNAKPDKWVDIFRLMRERDKRDPMEIKKMIEWVTNDVFWQSNILSAAALRKNYDRILLKMVKPNNQGRREKTVNDLFSRAE